MTVCAITKDGYCLTTPNTKSPPFPGGSESITEREIVKQLYCGESFLLSESRVEENFLQKLTSIVL